MKIAILTPTVLHLDDMVRKLLTTKKITWHSSLVSKEHIICGYMSGNKS